MTLGNFAYNAWHHSLEDESMRKWEDIRPQEKSPGSMPLKQSANGSKRVANHERPAQLTLLLTGIRYPGGMHSMSSRVPDSLPTQSAFLQSVAGSDLAEMFFRFFAARRHRRADPGLKPY
jgi:hypothetical protein